MDFTAKIYAKSCTPVVPGFMSDRAYKVSTTAAYWYVGTKYHKQTSRAKCPQCGAWAPVVHCSTPDARTGGTHNVDSWL